MRDLWVFDLVQTMSELASNDSWVALAFDFDDILLGLLGFLGLPRLPFLTVSIMFNKYFPASGVSEDLRPFCNSIRFLRAVWSMVRVHSISPELAENQFTLSAGFWCVIGVGRFCDSSLVRSKKFINSSNWYSYVSSKGLYSVPVVIFICMSVYSMSKRVISSCNRSENRSCKSNRLFWLICFSKMWILSNTNQHILSTRVNLPPVKLDCIGDIGTDVRMLLIPFSDPNWEQFRSNSTNLEEPFTSSIGSCKWAKWTKMSISLVTLSTIVAVSSKVSLELWFSTLLVRIASP